VNCSAAARDIMSKLMLVDHSVFFFFNNEEINSQKKKKTLTQKKKGKTQRDNI